jgi:hypothetical protein
MGQTPISLPNSITNNAAKDDVITEGQSFTIDTLLANDPGAAAKISQGTQFFFGEVTDYNGLGIDFATAASQLSASSWICCRASASPPSSRLPA